MTAVGPKRDLGIELRKPNEAETRGPRAPVQGPELAHPADAPLAPGLDRAASAPQLASARKGGEVVGRLRAELEAVGLTVVDLITKPARRSPSSVSYRFGGPEGRRLELHETLLLEIPPELRDRRIRGLVLLHRQDAAHDTGRSPDGRWDANPGLTAVNVHETGARIEPGQSDGWWKWNSPWKSSGQWGAKYADQRPPTNPESEDHFDIPERGMLPVIGDGELKRELAIDAVRVISMGKDPVFVHELTVNFVFELPHESEQAIFTPGTVFGDPATGIGTVYGGGQKFGGTYPGALELRADGGPGRSALLPGWSVKDGTLEIPLRAGRRVSSVEVACGDTHPDGVKNGDGGVGTSGHAILHLGLRDATGATQWFARRGVPPQGLVFATPELTRATLPGDTLVMRAEIDLTYVMGLRIGYRDA